MARLDKHDKVTHALKGKSAETKKKALHKMVEALIGDKSEEAQTHLHTYLQLKTREILVGESEESDDEKSEEKDEDKEDDKEEKDEDKEDDDKDDKPKPFEKKDDKDDKEEKKVDEALNFTGSSGMKRAPVRKHGNASPGLDDKVKSKFNFDGTGKKSGALKHGNAAPHLDDKVKGNVKFKNGGKNTLEKHGNAAPGLDGKIKGDLFK